jgi:gamma-glutamylcyclotransferase (GGCT)/AIG2-like uncharacterized protein YtfP
MARQIFVYGSLMFPPVYEGVTGTTPEFSDAKLPGFSRLAIHDAERTPYPAMVADPAGAVPGKLVSGVTDDELAALDRFEEVAAGLYSRRVVTVQGPSGYVEAEAYVASDELRTKLHGAWDPSVFEKEHLEKYLGTVVAQFRAEEGSRLKST